MALFSERVRQVLSPCTGYAVPIRPEGQAIGVSTFSHRGDRTLARLALDEVAQVRVNAVGVALIEDVGRTGSSVSASGSAAACRCRLPTPDLVRGARERGLPLSRQPADAVAALSRATGDH